VNIFFVGTFRRFVVDLGMDMRIAVVTTNLGPSAAAVGSRVELVFGADQAWFLPGESPPAAAGVRPASPDI